MYVDVRWYELSDQEDERWFYNRCLYAYLKSRDGEILYIGKCDGCSVRTRWQQKEDFWSDLERDRSIYSHVAIVGEIRQEVGRRLSRQLLADVESLLIWIIEPWGNIQCQQGRIRRPGLTVRCLGAWPLEQKIYRDD